MTNRGSNSVPGGEEFPDFLRPYQGAFEAELAGVLDGHDHALYAMMRHQLGWEGDHIASPGKYVRPGLLLLANEACGGDWRRALPAAVAIELLHNFSLIHDDIQDESPIRHGRPTVWQRWGTAQAINAGDGMYALSRLVLLGLIETGLGTERIFAVARLLDETCLKLCAGQYEDLAFQDRASVTVAEYESMVTNKTAAVFACALEMGAMVAAGQGAMSRRLADAGREMGIAYQMRDDVLDIWGGADTGKPVGIDLRRGKKSLPVVFGLSKGGMPDGVRLRALYADQLDEDAVEQVTVILGRLGVPERCAKATDEHWSRSRQLLRDSGVGQTGLDLLIRAAESLARRDS